MISAVHFRMFAESQRPPDRAIELIEISRSSFKALRAETVECDRRFLALFVEPV